MYVSPECGLGYWFGWRSAESLLKNAAEIVKPGNVVWDVGANMGLFSFASAGLVGLGGRVYAFEADIALAGLLRRSARLNQMAAPVEVIPCAVAEGLSLARFNIARRSRASNFLEGFGASQSGGVREVQTVLTVPLDWIAKQIPPPDVLKIDVEGAELRVFRGATQLLESKRPTLIFEAYEPSRQEITRILHDFGYTLYDSDLPASERRPLSEAVYNTLALPA
jgi:FkbM family methyltransferase